MIIYLLVLHVVTDVDPAVTILCILHVQGKYMG